MEYRTDYLAKITTDPGCHPGFDNYREDFEEEEKDGPQNKAGSKRSKKSDAVNSGVKGQTDNFSSPHPQ